MLRTTLALLVMAIGNAAGVATAVPISYPTAGNQNQQLPRVEKVTLDEHLQRIAGPKIADCGSFPLSAPVSSDTLNKGLACATTMEQRHLAFRVIQRGPSEDSEVAWGIVGTADGSVVSFSYDSAPCGGPQCADKFDTTTCRLAAVKLTKLTNGVYTLACSR